MWNIFLRALLVRTLIGRYKTLNDYSCPLYHQETKNIEHLFICCEILQSFWFQRKWNLLLVVLTQVGYQDSYIHFILSPPRTLLPKDVSIAKFTLTTVVMVETI